jgi:predicted Zn-dependent peptidase
MSGSPVGGSDGEKDGIAYQRSVLSNGLKVLVAPMPTTRSVSMGFYVGAGSRYETDDEAGVSHYLEHMLFKGTEKRETAKEISETIERVGGFMNASTDREVTVYWARVAHPHFELGLDLLSDMLLNSTFAPEEIEKERQVILEELHTVNDVPSQRAYLLADAALWPDQPLGRDIAGTPESVDGIRRKMLLDYMQGQYDPANSVLAIAGHVDEQRALDLANSLLGNWGRSNPRPWIPVEETIGASRCIVEYRRTEQSHICLTFPGVPATDPQRYAIDVLNALLGEGMASRLFLELRENRGIVYEVSSSSIHLRDCGAMTVYAGSDPRRAPEVVEAILRELVRVADDMQESELERARELVKGRLLLRLEDTRGVSEWLGAQELLLDRVYDPEEVVEELDRLDLDDLRSAARRVLRPEAFRLTVVGPHRSEKRFVRLLEAIS